MYGASHSESVCLQNIEGVRAASDAAPCAWGPAQAHKHLPNRHLISQRFPALWRIK